MPENETAPSETFDFYGFLAGRKPAQKEVTVLRDPVLLERVDELVAEIEVIDLTKTMDPSLAGAGAAGSARREDARLELEAAWAECEASGLVCVLARLRRGAAKALEQAVRDRFPRPDGAISAAAAEQLNSDRDAAFGEDTLRASMVGTYRPGSPVRPITDEEFAALYDELGPEDTDALTQAAIELVSAGQVSAPFSRRVSEALTKAESV